MTKPESVDGSRACDGYPPRRPDVAPSILVGLLGFGNYMMPPHLLPIMDCDNCQWRDKQWRDGGHCYMFREKPSGTRCGQMRVVGG